MSKLAMSKLAMSKYDDTWCSDSRILRMDTSGHEVIARFIVRPLIMIVLPNINGLAQALGYC